MVGIGGPSCSGKSTLAARLASAWQEPGAIVLAMDHFYRDLSALPEPERARCNFDEPEALDWPLLEERVGRLARGAPIQRPDYDFRTHTRRADVVLIEPAPILLLEGVLALHGERLRRLFDLAVFVDAPSEVRLARRIARDIQERGRTADSVRKQMAETVEPMTERFVMPSARHAGLVVKGLDIDRAVAQVLQRAAQAAPQ